MKNSFYLFYYLCFIWVVKDDNLPLPVNEDSEGYNLLLVVNSFLDHMQRN